MIFSFYAYRDNTINSNHSPKCFISRISVIIKDVSAASVQSFKTLVK